MDEKSQIQALDRTQPGLPLRQGCHRTQTHDYKRHGTTTLFAALTTLDGTVLPIPASPSGMPALPQTDRRADPGGSRAAPDRGQLRHPQTRQGQSWLVKHPRIHLHFTPTSASWLNMVERFFRDLTTRRLRDGIFHSVAELEAAIASYIASHNVAPKPFIWTASASDILPVLTPL